MLNVILSLNIKVCYVLLLSSLSIQLNKMVCCYNDNNVCKECFYPLCWPLGIHCKMVYFLLLLLEQTRTKQTLMTVITMLHIYLQSGEIHLSMCKPWYTSYIANQCIDLIFHACDLLSTFLFFLPHPSGVLSSGPSHTPVLTGH